MTEIEGGNVHEVIAPLFHLSNILILRKWGDKFE
jgi:hypothetical protein